jgi:hypothetical protein
MIEKYKQIVKAMYPNAYSRRIPYQDNNKKLKYEYVVMNGEIFDKEILYESSRYAAWKQAASWINYSMMKKLES